MVNPSWLPTKSKMKRKAVHPLGGSGASAGGMIERCVVVQRQKDGYGLTVTGDHPVYVYTVRQDGAAFCAGVRQGDRILKVNGMPVTSSNHLEVVRMISGGQNVVLTLLGKPPEPIDYKCENEYMKPDVKHYRSSEHISLQKSPFNSPPSNEEKALNRKELIHRMLEDEKRNIEDLRESDESKEKLEQALQRVEKLKSQLNLKQGDPPWMRTSATTELLSAADGDSEEDDLPLDSQAPFTSIVELKSRPAHLALFIEYLLSNGNPSSLFFYLITDAYQTCQATAKDFRRWAFEIFSTFLVPNGPMCLPNCDQTIRQPIDKILTATALQVQDSDGDTLRRIFGNARQRALFDVTDSLNDFRAKREMGLGSAFDSNQFLHLTRGDNSVEMRLAEGKLMKQLEYVLCSANNDYDSSEPRTQAIISSLATVIKMVLGIKPSASQWERMLEKCPTFLLKEKSSKFKVRTPASKRNIQVKGHIFTYYPVNIVHYCYQCRNAIWGIQPYAYFCLNCDVVVHKQCTSSLADACYPASQKNRQKSKRLGKMEDNGEESRRDDTPSRHPEPNVKSTSSDSGIGVDVHDKHVARSQSMRSRLSQMTTSTVPEDIHTTPRGRSALSWGADLTPADELAETHESARSHYANSTTSSGRNRSVEGVRLQSDVHSVSGSSSLSQDDELKRMMHALAESDSDLELETEIPSLEAMVGWDVVRHLKPKEKKRQEVINEFFHTERTHVRNLKIISKIFYKPMLVNNLVSQDVLYLIFANINDVLSIHQDMVSKMKKAMEEWRRDSSLNGLYGNIAPLMESMFEGTAGERLMEVTSVFCQHQQHALDILRSRYKKEKEDSFTRFLAEVESHPLCRKLQLKDMLPVEMQRLVKYPMLLENAAKYTQEESEEQHGLLKTVLSAKKILSAVNTAKRNAENLRRLEELQRRLDTTPYDKENTGNDYASLDLTKYHLIHDGPLTMRFNRGKMVELHVVLVEHILILLTRHSDGNKLLLKTLETSKEIKWSPILHLSPLIVKEKANDKRSFFILPNPEQKGAHIFEFVAATATERKTWLKLMSDQIEYVKKLPVQGIESFKFEVNATTVEGGEGQDKVHIVTHPRLVNANEITIQQPTVLEHAQPVLTPAERLKRNDQLIFQALLDKHSILAQFLPGDKKGREEQLEKLTELLGGLGVTDLKQRDPKELAMSAIVHGNRLLDSINQGMAAHKEEDAANPSSTVMALDDNDRSLPTVPCYKLTAIAAPLMNHLKALMQVVQSQQAELATVRQQLSRYKELAECSPCDRSVSEETLTESTNVDSLERKLMTKRTPRAPSTGPPL